MKKLIIISTLLCAFEAYSENETPVPVYSNVNYVGEGGHSKHLLDVYIPSGVDQPAKTVITFMVEVGEKIQKMQQ